MNKMYYITGAAILALVGLGIYSTQAQNAAADDADGIIIIEERGIAVMPDNTPNNTVNNNKTNTLPTQNQPMNNIDSNVNPVNNDVPAADFKPLPEDPGVEVAPNNQLLTEQTVNTQNPAQNDGVVVEEGVIETTTY